MDKPNTPIERLNICLDGNAERLVQAYFDHGRGFSGSTFDTYGHNPPELITGDDLLALTCLDEHVPPKTLRLMMSTEGQLELGQLLQAIDTEVSLGDPNDKVALQAAGEAWTTLSGEHYPGVGEVKAGKLLARKRPLLIPIVDSVVRTVVEAPPFGYWDVFREFMSLSLTKSRLIELREVADTHGVSDLRILDAAVWMRGSGSKSAYEVRDEFKIEDLSWAKRP